MHSVEATGDPATLALLTSQIQQLSASQSSSQKQLQQMYASQKTMQKQIQALLTHIQQLLSPWPLYIQPPSQPPPTLQLPPPHGLAAGMQQVPPGPVSPQGVSVALG